MINLIDCDREDRLIYPSCIVVLGRPSNVSALCERRLRVSASQCFMWPVRNAFGWSQYPRSLEEDAHVAVPPFTLWERRSRLWWRFINDLTAPALVRFLSPITYVLRLSVIKLATARFYFSTFWFFYLLWRVADDATFERTYKAIWYIWPLTWVSLGAEERASLVKWRRHY